MKPTAASRHLALVHAMQDYRVAEITLEVAQARARASSPESVTDWQSAVKRVVVTRAEVDRLLALESA